jgi:sugar phosphate isomerase/epimerase
MQLGFVSAILAELKFTEVLEFAASEGFDCVEVMCWPVGKAERKFAGVTHIDVVGLTQSQADDVNATIQKHGVGVSGLGFYPNPLDPEAEVSKRAVDHIKKVILAAEKLGLKQVNSFIGRDWTKSVDDNWPRFLKTWKPLVAFAEDRGVRIGIENCPMLFTADEWPGGKNLAHSPAVWRRMFQDIPSEHFGLNYDPSHLVWQQMDWLKPLSAFKDKLFHVHAKDVRFIERGLDDEGILATPLRYHQPRIPGFGEVDWGRFIGTLLQVGYNGPVCIEVEDDTFGKTLDGRKLAVRTSGRFLRNFIPSAR